METKINDKDSRLIEAAVKKHYDEIYLFILRRCGNEDNAKDICQNTFMKLACSVKAYKEKGKIRAYLFKIAINCCNDYYRNEKTSLPIDSLENSPDHTNQSPGSMIETKETNRKMEAVLSSLPPNQRDALLLRYCHNMKPREIAACLSVPVATVKTRLARAKKSFIKEWEND